MTFAQALSTVESATDAEALFGSDEPARVYRRLARVLHPDTAPPGQRDAATAAFAKLSTLWAGRPFATGDIATLFATGRHLTKAPRRPADSDLMEREATALQRVARHGDPKYAAYVPRLIETYRHEDPATGKRRRVNVIERFDGFVSLARVAETFPGGVDPRDVAWMWRRLLAGLGSVHRAGVVHGAVLPDHVLIHPAEHGLVLVDWCYSTEVGGLIPALVPRYIDDYPPEVAAKQPATEATDLYSATRCMLALMGPRAHPRLVRFARGCLLPEPRMRPHNAWALLGEFDQLLETLYGPRVFRPFALAG